jgi:hypothetical protein
VNTATLPEAISPDWLAILADGMPRHVLAWGDPDEAVLLEFGDTPPPYREQAVELRRHGALWGLVYVGSPHNAATYAYAIRRAGVGFRYAGDFAVECLRVLDRTGVWVRHIGGDAYGGLR